MLKKILATYLSMEIIYQEQEIIKHIKPIHASSTKINREEQKKKKKKKEYLLHERALLVKEYFGIQRNLFNSFKPKIIFLQKRNSKGKSL